MKVMKQKAMQQPWHYRKDNFFKQTDDEKATQLQMRLKRQLSWNHISQSEILDIATKYKRFIKMKMSVAIKSVER